MSKPHIDPNADEFLDQFEYDYRAKGRVQFDEIGKLLTLARQMRAELKRLTADRDGWSYR